MAGRYGRNSALAQYNRTRKALPPMVKCQGTGTTPLNPYTIPTIDGKNTTFGECGVCGMHEKVLRNGLLSSHKREPEA